MIKHFKTLLYRLILTAMKCNLDDLSLQVGSELPKNVYMILLAFQGIHEKKIHGSKWLMRRCDEEVPQDNDGTSLWQTSYYFAGLVVVLDANNSGHDSWRRIGAYIYSDSGI